MKFRNCVLLSCCLFAGLYAGWLAFQFDADRNLDRFDARQPVAASRQQQKPPREVPLQLVRRNQKNAVNLEKDRTSDATTALVRPEPQHHTQPRPSPEDVPSRQGTYGFAIRQLDLTFEAELPDVRFIQLVREQGCELVALKVQEEVIVDAFLPGETELLRRVTGPLASYRFDRYRTERPVSRYFWIRWQEPESPIGRQAGMELQRYGVSSSDYFVYLVLGEQLSQQIQDQLIAETQRQRIRPDKVGYARIALSQIAGSLVPSVVCIRPLPDVDAEPARRAEPRPPVAGDHSEPEPENSTEPAYSLGSENQADQSR